MFTECCCQPLMSARFDEPSYTGCWLCVDLAITIGQCRLRVHRTCGQNNPWHHLRTMSLLVGNPDKPLVGQQNKTKKDNLFALHTYWRELSNIGALGKLL